MKGLDSPNVDVLLLPVEQKYGALKKVEELNEELIQKNKDWKFIVNGLRSYLFDYLYDIDPYSKQVLPLIFYYIKEATIRKRKSAIRACDTFFDRYIYILTKVKKGDIKLISLKLEFDNYLNEYLDLILEKSEEEFYFDSSIEKIIGFTQTLDDLDKYHKISIKKLALVLLKQYEIYVKRSIVIDKEEIDEINETLPEKNRNPEIMNLFEKVSHGAYINKINTLEKFYDNNPLEFFKKDQSLYNFNENKKNWEKICLFIQNSINNDEIKNEESILKLLTFIVKKTNQGTDSEFQNFMSRIFASICAKFIENNQIELFKKVFDLLLPILFDEIQNGQNYMGAFSRIYDIGKPVIESNNLSLIDYFEDILIKSKFCFPKYSGIDADWSVISNGNHLENIRTWMKLIELNPRVMKKLSASLIVNLKLGGVFLKDTDVFQRDITRLLNSNFGDVFYLITSLAAVFPTFYHNIGATGTIRACTEKIDTNHQMNDLMHFIRKQIHVESSNRTVTLMQYIMEFWLTGKKQPLENMVPLDVYNNLDHFYRLNNFDLENHVVKTFEEIKEHYPSLATKRFWDFLNNVDGTDLLDIISKQNFDSLNKIQRNDMIKYISEYFQSQNPTEMTKILKYLIKIKNIDIRKTKVWDVLYEMPDEDLKKIFENTNHHNISEINIDKFLIFIDLYRMLYDKYNFSEVRAIEKLRYYASQLIFKPPDGFFEILTSESNIEALEILLQVQNSLKTDALLTDSKFEPIDTIEFKRHIAFGIPSMYGSYREKKFDTLKVFFQMNLIKLRLFEKIVENLQIENLEIIDYEKNKIILKLFYMTFQISGLANQEMNILFNLLETPNLRISQFRDIINQLLIIHGGISDRFNETYRYVCKEAINNIGLERISNKYVHHKKRENIEIVIDRFLRDQIMQFPLLQLFDNLLLALKSRIELTIKDHEALDVICLNPRTKRLELKLKAEDIKRMLDSPQYPNNDLNRSESGTFFPIYDIIRLPRAPEERNKLTPIWEVGNKAYGLLFMKDIEDIQVPDGIILSHYFAKEFNKDILEDHNLKYALIELLKRNVKSFTKNRFGNPDNPQLLSVRSGAVFFMPGVMSTITNVGITKGIIDHYSKQDEWFAYDCYRRFLQDIATSFYDVKRRVFENIITQVKTDLNVQLKEKMTGEQMKILAERYKEELINRGLFIPEDPYDQLLYSIIAANLSWNGPTAKNYRKFLNLSDHWGTAIIIQNMIFGNKSLKDITGVVQSNYHGDEKISLFGEYKTRAQGYDIVSGVANVFPISEDQKVVFPKYKKIISLEKSRPDLYKMIIDAVRNIRHRFGNEIQIELTVENKTLYLLQVRGLATHTFQKEEIIEKTNILQKAYLGDGLAASGGAVSGRAVFKTDRIDIIRERYKGDKIILIRPETNPEDVVGLQKSDGILTCLGGMTSHAVLQMRRFKKSGISNFSTMKIDENRNLAIVNKGANKSIKIFEGDYITIDGDSGKVYQGYFNTRLKRMKV
jgi:pyruvate,orthophosphate dikinase